jgi:hypothetical protein
MNRHDGMNTSALSGTRASMNTVADAVVFAATVGSNAPAPD